MFMNEGIYIELTISIDIFYATLIIYILLFDLRFFGCNKLKSENKRC